MAAETAQRTDAPAERAGGLDVRLDAPLPAAIAVGAGNALFVCGTCFAPGVPIAHLTLLVDGAEQELLAYGMPRLDLMKASGTETSYRAGFWGFARIGPRPGGGSVELGLRARLRDGGRLEAELGRVDVAEPVEPLPGAPLVAICMAAFEPPIDLFRRQVDSIRAQTVGDWLCIVSDDCSDPERFAAMQDVLAGDPRFVLSRSDRRQGFYRNFERAMQLAPAGARFVALADQDDVWDPDKLESLVREIGDAQLAYSDQRIVSTDGELIARTYWERRANNHADMLSLLVANCVTGAASLFPRRLLDDALPLPPAQFTHYHDHWLAVVALALGDIRYVDRALYDYVQHTHATLGHATATRMTRLHDRLSSLRRGPRERVRLWRMHYFADVCRLLHFATVLQMRCGPRMAPRKRRAVSRFMRAEASALPIPRLFARGGRELLRRRPQTLAAEWMLAYAFTWRRLLAATARDRPQQTVRLDALPPLVLAPDPRAHLPGDPDLKAVAEQIGPLRLAVRDDAPPRINMLVPAIDPAAASHQLARRLAARGLRVRLVTVDPVGARPRQPGLAGVEVQFGRESPEIEISRADTFVATRWWTAHVARAALRTVDADRFLYLIEDDESLAYGAGTFAALAAQSYGFPHVALYSSALLGEHFGRGGEVFEEAVTGVAAPTAGDLARSGSRRLLFHAGPEPHAMFELGVLALSRALERGAFARDWTLHAVGAERRGRRLDLGGGDWMLLERSAGDLRGYDVGLALVRSPRPGRMPIAMAAAGMVTVTSTFATKTGAALAAISPNLIGAEPAIEAIADALHVAAERAADVEARVRGSAVRWSRDWDSSFDDALLDRVIALLRA